MARKLSLSSLQDDIKSFISKLKSSTKKVSIKKTSTKKTSTKKSKKQRGG